MRAWREPPSQLGQPLAQRPRLTVACEGHAETASPPTTAFALHPSQRLAATVSGLAIDASLTVLPYANDDNSVALAEPVQVRLPKEPTAVAWQQDTLLVGSTAGTVFSFARPTATASHATHAPLATFAPLGSAPAPGGSPAGGPRRLPRSLRIASVATTPLSPDVFAAAEDTRIHIWSLANESAPISSEKGSTTQLTSVTWNPHSASVLALGSFGGSIKVLDARLLSGGATKSKRPVVWKQSSAHTASVLAVEWSPLVPHWVASTGDDCAINIWDTRMGSVPVAVLHGHESAVTSLSWSRLHCDQLVSSSCDHSVRFWSLRVPPHYAVASWGEDEVLDAFVGVGYCPLDPNFVIAASAEGRVQGLALSSRARRDLVPYRNPQWSDVELHMSRRDFRVAFERIAASVRDLLASGRLQEAKELLDLSSSRRPDSAASFQEELQHYTYYVPPNLPMHLIQPPSSACLADLDWLRTRIAISEALSSGRALDSEQQQKALLARLREHPADVHFALLRTYLQHLVRQDILRALALGLELFPVLAGHQREQDMAKLAYLLLYPTIYDIAGHTPPHPGLPERRLEVTRGAKQRTRLALNTYLSHTKLAVNHVRLLHEVLKTTWQSRAASSKVVKLLDAYRQDPSVTGPSAMPGAWPPLSGLVNRLFLDALLHKSRFDVFFMHACDMFQLARHLEFSRFAQRLMVEQGYDKLRQYLKTCISSASTTGPLGEDAKSPRGGLTVLLNIMRNCKALPDPLPAKFTEQLTALTNALQGALQAATPSRDLQTAARTFAANIERLYPKTLDPGVLRIQALLRKVIEGA